MDIEAFADKYGLVMEVQERNPPDEDLPPYCARFKDAAVKPNVFSLQFLAGDGATPDEAIANYAVKISRRLLIIDTGDIDERREIMVPELTTRHATRYLPFRQWFAKFRLKRNLGHVKATASSSDRKAVLPEWAARAGANVAERLAHMNETDSIWHGNFVTKQGDEVREEPPAGCLQSLRAGAWLWFHCSLGYGQPKPNGDVPLFVADVACFWLAMPSGEGVAWPGADGRDLRLPFRDDHGRGLQFSTEVVPYLVPDETYAEWTEALQALDRWFAEPTNSNWAPMWSRRSSRVKAFMLGQHKNWMSF